MSKKTKSNDSLAVDKGLVAMFLKMSVEKRLQANDNAVQTILELRDAYKRKKNTGTKPHIQGGAQSL